MAIEAPVFPEADRSRGSATEIIHTVSYGFQVLRVDAAPIPAEVIKFKAGRDRGDM